MNLPDRIGDYRIDGLLGKGGMGAVYRAFDDQLGRTVAIKQIRASELAEPEAMERFLREARSTAQLRHPAIVQTLHMIKEDGQDYIVMEHVDGRTLSSLLQEEGPLPHLRAIALFRTIAEGLAVAHAHGIVHRDIKAQNLMVTSEDQARILDFGLAKRLNSEEVSLSATGRILGTPRTMSPEQARGEKVDHRSDLFSLGVVLYEALTGQAPFRADSVTATLVKVCMDHPPPPKDLNSDIPLFLDDLIVRLLQKEPQNRPQSAAEVATALAFDEDSEPATLNFVPARPASTDRKAPTHSITRQETSDQSTWVAPQSPAKKRRGLLTSALTAALLILAIWAVWRTGSPETPESPMRETIATSPTTSSVAAALFARPSVAVLGLENLSGNADNDWLATAISEVIVTELRAGDGIRVVGGDEVARVEQQLAQDSPNPRSTESLLRLSRILGVESVVWGTYSNLNEQAEFLVRIDLRLQDAASSEVLASEESTGTIHQLVSLVSRTVNEFRQQLEVDALTPTEELESEAAMLSDVEALRLYSEGLTRLRQLDYAVALERFQAAVDIEKHPMPLAAMAEAWSALGYEDEARQAAEEAQQLSVRLPKRLRQIITARHHAAIQDWSNAAQLYQNLFATSPDDVDIGLQLVDVLITAGEIPEAKIIIEALSRLPDLLSSDPRINLARARIAYHQGETEDISRFAEAAASQGKSRGIPLVVAQASLWKAEALVLLGEQSRSIDSLKEAKRLFDAHGGDPQAYAKGLELTASSVLNRGDLAGAHSLFAEALVIYDSIGNHQRSAAVKGSLAQVRLNEGKLQEAAQLFEESLAGSRRLGDKKEEAITLNNLGTCFFLKGEWKAALDSYSKALALSEELRDTSGVAFASTNIAEILYIQGDLNQAREMHIEALRINRKIPDPYGIAYDTFRLGKVLAAKGDLFAAREQYAEALEIQQNIGEKAAAAETRIEQAFLELIDGSPELAEKLAGQAEEVLRNEGWSDLALRAKALQVRALFTSGQMATAQSRLGGLERDAAESQDRRAKLAASIATAQVRAISPKQTSVAVQRILDVAKQAAEAGYIEESLEARLMASTLELANGQTSVPRDRLKELEDEARSRGFGQIAQRAAQARTP